MNAVGAPFFLEWETLVLPSFFLRAFYIEEDSFPPLPYKRELKRKEYHIQLTLIRQRARKKKGWEYKSFPLQKKKPAPTIAYSLYFVYL